MRMIDIIRKKREGGSLSRAEMAFFLQGYTAGRIPDYQAAALLMACFLRGMDESETLAMTEEILHSGDVIDLSHISAYKVDKHSTGGVGDGCSIAIAPIAAACGVCVPMISGRGLGHTGGTLDKLESISGYRTQLTGGEFVSLLERVGAAVVGQSERMAPADRKLYALRDATGTVESIPLITASIMGKKLSEGIDGLVLDVKTGSGAFMKTLDESRALARSMVKIGKAAHKQVVALITDMDRPLGNVIGNSLEVIEAFELLHGRAPEDYTELVLTLTAHMLSLAGYGDADECKQMARRAVEDGSALAKCKEMIAAQGGDPDWTEHTERFPRAAHTHAVTAPFSGYLEHMDTEACGLAAVALGAGRNKKEDTIDAAAGIKLFKKTGDSVTQGEVLARFYAEDAHAFSAAEEIYTAGIKIGQTKPVPRPLVWEIVR